MVTGLVDAGEDISAAAEREVLEETGVKATFAAVLALRQAHGFAFGKSDFFFVVALKCAPANTCTHAHRHMPNFILCFAAVERLPCDSECICTCN